MKHLFTTLLVMLSALLLAAQNPYELIDANRDRLAGHYHYYEVPEGLALAYPEGYVPFYISHYGRHGCRWHTSSLVYRRPIKELEKINADSMLTPVGKALLHALNLIADEAEGKGGELTPRGVREHRGIAERMYASFPEVFHSRDGIPVEIESRSTDVTRCILSMCAFNERLKELDPSLQISRTAWKKDLDYLINREGQKKISKRAKASCDSVQRVWLKPERFMSSIVKDPSYPIQAPEKLMYHIYQIASILQDTDESGLSLYEYFTPWELDALWRCENAYVYLTLGPSLEYGDYTIPDAKPLLSAIIRTADEVVAGKSSLRASLRFGHDQALVPLYALMGIEGCADRVRANEADQVWNVSTVTPMATNLQLIFFRPEKKAYRPEEIKVRILHNEKDARLPIGGFPYYSWGRLRTYLLEKCR